MTIKILITFILEYLFHHTEKSKVLIVNENIKILDPNKFGFILFYLFHLKCTFCMIYPPINEENKEIGITIGKIIGNRI